MAETYSKRCWFTFPSRTQVEQPIIWQMSRTYPNVMFDIRQASVQNEIGIMAVLLSGSEAEVKAAVQVMRGKGGMGGTIEKSVGEGGTRGSRRFRLRKGLWGWAPFFGAFAAVAIWN